MLQRGGWKGESGREPLLAVRLSGEQRELGGRDRTPIWKDCWLTCICPTWRSERPLAKRRVTLVLSFIIPCVLPPPPKSLPLLSSLLFWWWAPDWKDFWVPGISSPVSCVNHGWNGIQPQRLQNEVVCSLPAPQGLCTGTYFPTRRPSCPWHHGLQGSEETPAPPRGRSRLTHSCPFLPLPYLRLWLCSVLFLLLSCILFTFPSQNSSRKAGTMIILFAVMSLLLGT